MTRKKPGQKHPTENSANAPILEATPASKDGPEGYYEDVSIIKFEDDKTKAPERDTVTKSSGSGGGIITGSPRTIEKDLALKPSRFGSPFAYVSYQNKYDFFKGLLAENTCVLFDQVVAEASTLRERLSRGVALTTDGSNGQFCFLKKCDTLSTNSEAIDSDDSQLELSCFELNEDRLEIPLDAPVDSINSSDLSSTKIENSKDDRIIDVRRVQNSETGESEYFVMNWSLDLLSINGIDVNPTVRAGPLPDFAVLELERFSIFWWRTTAALDFMPSLKRKRDSEENDEELSRKAIKGDADLSPNSQVFPDSKSWLDEYRRRIRLCEERPIKYTSSITDVHPPHKLSVYELQDIDVILAIGAVWLGLIHAKIDFAYAGSNLFSFARSMRMVGMHAVKGPNHFLIPLLFSEELEALTPESEKDTEEPLEPVFGAFQRGEEKKNQENFAAAEKAKQKDPGNMNQPPLSPKDQEIRTRNHKGGIGHFVLAIAEKVNRDQATIIKDYLTKKAPVRLRFMDSSVGHTDKGTIRRAARNIVRNSGWLGDTWPCFDATEEYWTDVLEQSGNRCGEHTVLNAWAYMLEIPLATTRGRALAKRSYEEVRTMIHLALRGQLDSLTIRAWMQNHGYAINEPLSQLQQTQQQNPDLPNTFRNIQTVALNEDAFNEIINDMHMQEQATNQGHATVWGAVPVPPDVATTQQSGHAPNMATGVAVPPSSQDSTADPSGASEILGGSTGSAGTPQLLQAPHGSPKTWRESLDRGLAYHNALRAENPRTTEDRWKRATVIENPSNMADYDVVLGIAPIWEGLKRLGLPAYDFTYAGLDVFAPGGGSGLGAIGRFTRFIIPLFLSSTKAEALEDQGEGKKKITDVGHLLLCVAELVDSHPKVVQIHVLDSRVNTVHFQQIEQAAEAIISRSGWLGRIRPEAPVEYRPYLRTPVPHQVGGNTCGLHVIFNAWATMLGIPIHPSMLRRRPSRENANYATDERFLELGLEIVNLALEGFMDSTTIQAFLNVFGYSVEQRHGDPARAVVSANAIGMNQDKFGRTLQKRFWGPILTYTEGHPRRFPDASIAYLISQGLSVDQAQRALSLNNGNPNRAFNWHYSMDPPGELPKPEDALSPKTPDRGRGIP